MEKSFTVSDISHALHTSVELSRNELQHSQPRPGDIVGHAMFDSNLTVIKQSGSRVLVEFYNDICKHSETAILPLEELYYPDLAAGALILQLLS